MPTKLHSLFSSYLSHLERKGDKDETVKRNRHALARHDAWLSDLWIEPPKVTELVVEEYFAWLDGVVEQTTANREAGMVRGAYRYAVRIGMIDKDPAEYVKPPLSKRPNPTSTPTRSFGGLGLRSGLISKRSFSTDSRTPGFGAVSYASSSPKRMPTSTGEGTGSTTSISSVRRSR
jgi:hypothetical protein